MLRWESVWKKSYRSEHIKLFIVKSIGFDRGFAIIESPFVLAFAFLSCIKLISHLMGYSSQRFYCRLNYPVGNEYLYETRSTTKRVGPNMECLFRHRYRPFKSECVFLPRSLASAKMTKWLWLMPVTVFSSSKLSCTFFCDFSFWECVYYLVVSCTECYKERIFKTNSF